MSTGIHVFLKITVLLILLRAKQAKHLHVTIAQSKSLLKVLSQQCSCSSWRNNGNSSWNACGNVVNAAIMFLSSFWPPWLDQLNSVVITWRALIGMSHKLATYNYMSTTSYSFRCNADGRCNLVLIDAVSNPG